MTTPTQTIELKPYLRNGQELIAGLWSGQVNMTATEYHGIRDDIMKMRSSDRATGDLYDKYLKEVIKGGKTWPNDQMQNLYEGLGKHKLGISNELNDVARDLQAHRYDPYYKPAVAVSVNNRPMHPEVVVRELNASGATINADIPRSVAPGKISTSALTFKESAITEGIEKTVSPLRNAVDVERKLGGDRASILGQVMQHTAVGQKVTGLERFAKMIPVLGKFFSFAGLATAGTAALAAPTAAERNEIILKEGAGLIDPTGGIISEGLPLAVQDIRENGARRTQESRINPHNLAITRAEDFLLSSEHPGQLGALKIKDASGKPLDVAKLLLDPQGQKLVLAEIDKRAENATTPESKELFQSMKEAAEEFITLEGRKKVAPIEVEQTQSSQPAVRQQLSMAPSQG